MFANDFFITEWMFCIQRAITKYNKESCVECSCTSASVGRNENFINEICMSFCTFVTDVTQLKQQEQKQNKTKWSSCKFDWNDFNSLLQWPFTRSHSSAVTLQKLEMCLQIEKRQREICVSWWQARGFSCLPACLPSTCGSPLVRQACNRAHRSDMAEHTTAMYRAQGCFQAYTWWQGEAMFCNGEFINDNLQRKCSILLCAQCGSLRSYDAGLLQERTFRRNPALPSSEWQESVN
jgi:hypothetical protein